MTDGAKCRSNRKLRTILFPMVKSYPIKHRFKVKELAGEIRGMPHRDIHPMTLGCLLRECPEVKPLGNGVWERVKV